MSFWTKTNPLIKLLFPKYVWNMPTHRKTVYLTFDDGPIPGITEWVLEQLKMHGAKATFFCIGKNVVQNPAVFNKVLADGHAIGNHTFDHRNGWKTTTAEYLQDADQCDAALRELLPAHPQLFRPPYGKITPSQSRQIRKMGYQIIMWDVISFDFDHLVTPQQCLENVLKNVSGGSIVVFHDSVKAFKNLEYVLPATLQYLKENGYTCEAIV